MMATDYPHYLVADINPDLINLYRSIAEDTENFINLAKAVLKVLLSLKIIIVREAFNHDPQLDRLHRAVYFLYLNRHCYRGLCRYNLSGVFNVPFGNYKSRIFLRVKSAHLLRKRSEPPLFALTTKKRCLCCRRAM